MTDLQVLRSGMVAEEGLNRGAELPTHDKRHGGIHCHCYKFCEKFDVCAELSAIDFTICRLGRNQVPLADECYALMRHGV